ncbi:1-aminocyclopropane-1-carboxylate deaminase/D-cysteine desulfhydrase [uncultured Zhongshania sp.]|uniref:1-aminocyclopropane-1-carboxylate deaminase/D-cysteine desulfhydrase n=1 Tax=uncultured Zhongshania sp. TaxID=1642288 RepID=UPI0025E75A75|nr:pyridoxal-phosphate dependent enzyme [uncultured Zhongshania sp.]
MSLIEYLFTSSSGVGVDILRLDSLEGPASGNKWFKLVLNIEAAEHAAADCILSFGGAYSNHLHALAAVGFSKGFATIGCVRADPSSGLTPTLQDAKRWGMSLHYLSRSEYRRRHDQDFISELQAQYPSAYIVPEGGGNTLGAKGCAGIVDLIPNAGRDYAAIVLACGTGTTLVGIASKVAEGVSVIGVPVLKAEKFMASDITAMFQSLKGDRGNWRLDHRFHGGAYARLPEQMAQYMREFELEYGVYLDPIYTAKAAYALQCMVENNEFAAGSRVLLVHTGGLQGRRGFGLNQGDTPCLY